ncbi:hypothetical protein [Parafrankia sp. FMc2]|uniref:hypothetical protein n=1 Tax=Parafrankia sp. FMc2 TaxID=3233196 RepID=UPI0034D55702
MRDEDRSDAATATGLGPQPRPRTADAPAAVEWDVDAADLPDLVLKPDDSLIVGLLPGPTSPDRGGQDMLLCDLMPVDEIVLVGAGIGVAQLSTVGLVLVHRRFTALMQSRVAWAVGLRLRQRRRAAGELPRVVMAGSMPDGDMIPDGVTFTAHTVRVRDHGVISRLEVWEVHFPALEPTTAQASPPL